MIALVETQAQRREFLRRIEGKCYFAPYLSTMLTLYGEKPGSGWQFFLLSGSAALALRGGVATMCGVYDEPQETAEELASFLGFVGAERLLCEHAALLPQGWQWSEPKHRFALEAGQLLTLPAEPQALAALELCEAPRFGAVSRLAFAEPEEQENFYSHACTSVNHGHGVCWALLEQGRPVVTVGSYERCPQEAYMAAGVAEPRWRGTGLAAWLIVRMANALSAQGMRATFLCDAPLCGYYKRLGFAADGMVLQAVPPET